MLIFYNLWIWSLCVVSYFESLLVLCVMRMIISQTACIALLVVYFQKPDIKVPCVSCEKKLLVLRYNVDHVIFLLDP